MISLIKRNYSFVSLASPLLHSSAYLNTFVLAITCNQSTLEIRGFCPYFLTVTPSLELFPSLPPELVFQSLDSPILFQFISPSWVYFLSCMDRFSHFTRGSGPRVQPRLLHSLPLVSSSLHILSIQFIFHVVNEWFLLITDLTLGVWLQAQTYVWSFRPEPRLAFSGMPQWEKLPSPHRTWCTASVLHSVVFYRDCEGSEHPYRSGHASVYICNSEPRHLCMKDLGWGTFLPSDSELSIPSLPSLLPTGPQVHKMAGAFCPGLLSSEISPACTACPLTFPQGLSVWGKWNEGSKTSFLASCLHCCSKWIKAWLVFSIWLVLPDH